MLRISSQHIVNCGHHGIISKTQVLESFKRLAPVADHKSANDVL